MQIGLVFFNFDVPSIFRETTLGLVIGPDENPVMFSCCSEKNGGKSFFCFFYISAGNGNGPTLHVSLPGSPPAHTKLSCSLKWTPRRVLRKLSWHTSRGTKGSSIFFRMCWYLPAAPKNEDRVRPIVISGGMVETAEVQDGQTGSETMFRPDIGHRSFGVLQNRLAFSLNHLRFSCPKFLN